MSQLNISDSGSTRDSLLADIGVSTTDINTLNDFLTGQTQASETPPTFSTSVPETTLHEELGKLKSLWSQLPDPLDERIITVLDKICKLTRDTRRDLTAKYKTLINLTGPDFNELLDELVLATTKGPTVLHYMIKISIRAYSLGIAKNAQVAIADIINISTEANVMLSEAFEQQAWNSVVSSMTNYMIQIDTKTLQNSIPTKQFKTKTTTPSLDSRASPDPTTGHFLKLEFGLKYRCKYGTLNFIDSENIGFISETSEGAFIAKLIGSTKSVKVLERVINKDLGQVCVLLKNQEVTLNNYKSLDQEERFKFLSGIIEQTKDLTGQWAVIVKP